LSRLARRRSLAWRLLAAGLVAAGVATASAGAAPAASAGWSAPVDLMAPGTLDVSPPVATLAADGALTAAFALQDVDVPGSAAAQVAQRAPDGLITPARPLPGLALPLAAGQAGGAPLLLGGIAAADQTCCTALEVLHPEAGSGAWSGQRLAAGLDGQTIGQLAGIGDGHTLAAWATTDGVWAAMAAGHRRFGAVRRLAGPARSPQTLAAAALNGGGSMLAWDSVAGPAGRSAPRTITVAQGTRGGIPGRPVTAETVPTGHRVAELAVAGRGGSATLAWIDAWSDGAGEHEQVLARDLGAAGRPRSFAAPATTADGLQLVADPAGAQALSWSACRANGSCQVMLAAHASGRAFGPARSLGAIDPGQVPALALGEHGQLLLAFTRGGAPLAVTGSAGSRLGRPHRLSSTTYAFDITAVLDPAGREAAVWSQGTLNPSVVGAVASP
jgi:hypothetical protein